MELRRSAELLRSNKTIVTLLVQRKSRTSHVQTLFSEQPRKFINTKAHRQVHSNLVSTLGELCKKY